MQSRNEENSFHYTYSAKEQEEIKKIRQKYQPKEETKMDKLRRLDAGVAKKATAFSLSIGIVGVLVMGSGMSLVMSDLVAHIGLDRMHGMVIGIILGIFGIVLMCFAYPLYCYILRKERKKLAPEILRLTDELMR